MLQILKGFLSRGAIIAIISGLLALGGIVWTSYKFYGNYISTKIRLESLQVSYKELENNNKKLEKSEKILSESVQNTSKQNDKLQSETNSLKDSLNNLKTESKCEKEDIVNIDGRLPSDAISLLNRAYCIQNGDQSNCSASTSQ